MSSNDFSTIIVSMPISRVEELVREKTKQTWLFDGLGGENNNILRWVMKSKGLCFEAQSNPENPTRLYGARIKLDCKVGEANHEAVARLLERITDEVR